MSITPVPISIRLVLTPMAARSGKGDDSWRAKWWTRTNAPSIPISSAAIASSTVWRSASPPVCVSPPPGCQAPNERKPILLSPAISVPARTLLMAQVFRGRGSGDRGSGDRGPGEVGVDELNGHRAFADGGGAAFGRAGAHVTGREHAGNVGFEQVLRVRRRAGEDEAVVVAGDGV